METSEVVTLPHDPACAAGEAPEDLLKRAVGRCDGHNPEVRVNRDSDVFARSEAQSNSDIVPTESQGVPGDAGGTHDD